LARALPAWEGAQAQVHALVGKTTLQAISAAADRLRAG
jgi:hypothetical protein